MTIPAHSDYPPQEAGCCGVPDEALSPEELEDLEAFRAIAKIGREVTARQMAQLIRRIE